MSAERRAALLADLATAIRAVPAGLDTESTGIEVFRCLESAVNEGAIPGVQSWHLPRAVHHEERDEREHRRNRNERISAAKLDTLCRARLGDWIARRVRSGGKVTAQAVLSQRAGAIMCDAIAEYVSSALTTTTPEGTTP